ncbi:hypothetical protein [Bifidobacterium catulorum]|uniref:hypothetical protein n=1 Tax=Bifidobacterium catulorum TaxID=1630173 RepID=UPI0011B1FCDA|nr:hypothetical protein [Bifidobacterium catulorum]
MRSKIFRQLRPRLDAGTIIHKRIDHHLVANPVNDCAIIHLEYDYGVDVDVVHCRSLSLKRRRHCDDDSFIMIDSQTHISGATTRSAKDLPSGPLFVTKTPMPTSMSHNSHVPDIIRGDYR